MQHYPSTSLFREILVTIFAAHLIFREIAVLVLEAFMIHAVYLTEDLRLDLLYEIVDSIAVDEGAFLGVMRVEVEIKCQTILLA